MLDKIPQHELSTITFFPPGNGKVEKWFDTTDLTFSGDMLMFTDSKGKKIVVSGGCYLIEQKVKTPESSVILTVPKSNKSILDIGTGNN